MLEVEYKRWMLLIIKTIYKIKSKVKIKTLRVIKSNFIHSYRYNIYILKLLIKIKLITIKYP